MEQAAGTAAAAGGGRARSRSRSPPSGGHGLRVRPARGDEAEELAAICMEAFNSMAAEVGLPPEFLAPPVQAFRGKIGHPSGRSDVLVAERDGRIVGSAGVAYHDDVAGIGPVSVRADCADRGTGRRLMEELATWCESRGAQAVRLTQLASNVKAFALYASLGYEARLQLAVVRGRVRFEAPGVCVRLAAPEDAAACAGLYRQVTGERRAAEIAGSLRAPGAAPPLCAMAGGELVGYSTGFATSGHAVSRSVPVLLALLAAASGELQGASGPGSAPPLAMVPSQLYPDLLRSCLQMGMRVTQLRTLMARGAFDAVAPPGGAVYLPSITF